MKYLVVFVIHQRSLVSSQEGSSFSNPPYKWRLTSKPVMAFQEKIVRLANVSDLQCFPCARSLRSTHFQKLKEDIYFLVHLQSLEILHCPANFSFSYRCKGYTANLYSSLHLIQVFPDSDRSTTQVHI